MRPDDIIAFVLAGGQGTRLRPLTDEQAKPALRFTEHRRLIDFVLSNLYNSGVRTIYVLCQYKPRTLIEHIQRHWADRLARAGGSIQVLLPESQGVAQFAGTADAVFQCRRLIERHRPELVAVFAADHVYRMDVRQMILAHRQKKAQVTIAATPVPIAQAGAFGVIAADADERIVAFQEKPPRPVPIPAQREHAYVSMGNYLFDRDVLLELLRTTAERGGTDFGWHTMPLLAGRYRAYAYDFARNAVPGRQPWEDRVYWRDVGTLCAYEQTLQELAGPHPRFDLDNAQWPIHGTQPASAIELPATSPAELCDA